MSTLIGVDVFHSEECAHANYGFYAFSYKLQLFSFTFQNKTCLLIEDRQNSFENACLTKSIFAHKAPTENKCLKSLLHHSEKCVFRRKDSFLCRIFSNNTHNHMNFFNDVFRKELIAQKPFWNTWHQEKNSVKKLVLLELYPTFMIPMRLWTVCPYPSACLLILGSIPLIVMEYFPGYENYWFIYALCIFGPLCEMSVFCIVWYWIPGGKQMLCSFFYGEQNIAFFFGNPGSKVKTLMIGTAALSALKMAYVGHSLADVYVQKQQLALATEKMALASEKMSLASDLAQKKLRILKEMGTPITSDIIQDVFDEAKRELAPPGTDVTASLKSQDGKIHTNVGISHNGNGVNMSGNISHTSSHLPGTPGKTLHNPAAESFGQKDFFKKISHPEK